MSEFISIRRAVLSRDCNLRPYERMSSSENSSARLHQNTIGGSQSICTVSSSSPLSFLLLATSLAGPPINLPRPGLLPSSTNSTSTPTSHHHPSPKSHIPWTLDPHSSRNTVPKQQKHLHRPSSPTRTPCADTQRFRFPLPLAPAFNDRGQKFQYR